SVYAIRSARSPSSWVRPAWAPSQTRPLSSGKKSRSWPNAGRPKVPKNLPQSTAPGPAASSWSLKDPRGFKEFIDQLSEHSPKGAALTLRGVQARRPSPFELTQELEKMTIPTLIIHGDEDRSCLGTGAFLKRTIPSAGLMVFPKTGHTINLEEPG